MTAIFQSIFPSTAERPRPKIGGSIEGLVKSTFHLSTILLLGGFAQGILSLLLPRRYALLPTAILLLRTAIHAVRDSRAAASADDDYYVRTQGVVRERTSAWLPSASSSKRTTAQEGSGERTSKDDQGKSIVVFHIGVRFHHPLGIPGTPNSRELGAHFQACQDVLLEQAKKYGCLGGSTYFREGGNETLSVFYFRDLEGLERFAHEKDGVHKKAWEWFERMGGYSFSSSTSGQKGGEGKKTDSSATKHFGIFHETFVVPAGKWESLYVNMPPTLLGGGWAPVKNEETGEEEWVRTLTEAKGRDYKSMRTRMVTNQ